MIGVRSFAKYLLAAENDESTMEKAFIVLCRTSFLLLGASLAIDSRMISTSADSRREALSEFFITYSSWSAVKYFKKTYTMQIRDLSRALL
jgi:hypothetical protein